MLKRLIANMENQRGFALIELVIVLVLMGAVMAGTYRMFFFSQNSFNRVDAEAAAMQEKNLFLNRYSTEIRSAQRPNQATQAVRVYDGGQEIDIYLYNSASNRYERIHYRLDGNQLQRGWADTANPGQGENPLYGNIDNWQTVLNNINGGAGVQLFRDITPDNTSERRLIEVNLVINAGDVPLSTFARYMTRSGRPAFSLASGDNDSIPATGVSIDPESIRINRFAQNIYVTAAIIPVSAADKDLTWSSGDDWITFQGGSAGKSGVTKRISIKAVPLTEPFGWREGRVTVTTVDGDFQATLQIRQSKGAF